MKTFVTETPILCPRCLNKVDPDCPACEGEGVVIETETITEDGWDWTGGYSSTPPAVVPSIPSPGIYPYMPNGTGWPKIYPYITWAGIDTCNSCGS
jgi:hypothetical protein